MPNDLMPVNADANPEGATAPLTNIALFTGMMDRLMNRPAHLPGLGVFYGFSGYGKTRAAIQGAIKYRCLYVECGESWTKARFLRAVLGELGMPTKGTAATLVERAAESMGKSRVPLIIDEADHIVRRGYIETIREIADASKSAIALIGEEMLPHMIEQRSERTHNRVLAWEPAQPASLDDAQIAAGIFYPHLTFAPDLIAAIVAASGARIRRIMVNLDLAATTAATEGWPDITVERWGNRPWYTGQAPARRAR